MNTNLILVVGILALVLLITNYAIMQPIGQEQLGIFKREAVEYISWSRKLQNLYEVYQTILAEIYLVSAVCIAIALICFYYVGYKHLRSLRKFKQTKLQTR